MTETLPAGVCIGTPEKAGSERQCECVPHGIVAQGLQWFRILRMAWMEFGASNELQRQPEPETMKAVAEVSAFHREGKSSGALIPIYHFNALRLSRMLPAGGTLLDLGSGSGQFLMYLAKCRPDLRMIGVDLSKEMVELGRRELRLAGLDTRVELCTGDMTGFQKIAPKRVDAVSSIFSLHHLQSMQDLERCVREIGRLRKRTGCRVWIFDHTRPRLRRTADDFPALFMPEASSYFQANSRASLLAAFQFQELRECLQRALPDVPASVCSRVLRLYQAHQLPRRERNQALKTGAKPWVEPALSSRAARDFRGLQALFSRLPETP